jgi:hypothetical protein
MAIQKPRWRASWASIAFYFRLYPDTIHTAQGVDFLTHLLRQLAGKLLVI